MRRILVLVCVAAWFVFCATSVEATYPLTSDYLCEAGKTFLKQERYEEALDEFQKALIANPDSAVAKKYIDKIKTILALGQEAEVIPAAPRAASSTQNRTQVMKGALSQYVASQTAPLGASSKKTGPSQQETPTLPQEIPSGTVITLQEAQESRQQPLQIELGKSLVITGRAIQRYLVTETRVIDIVRKDADTLMVSSKDIGYTYLHVWDDSGRSTLEFLVVPRKPQMSREEEQARLAEERFDNFKFSYSLDWSSFESGRRLNTLKRSNYSFVHNLIFLGQTPYGNIDSTITVNRFTTRTELSHYTIGLTDGLIGDFKGFNVRGFDIFDLPPKFSNLVFAGTSLRGGLVSSPAFNNKLNYTVYYGRENTIPLGNLSPEVNKTRDAFVNGLNLNLVPTPQQNYNLNFVHGWGKDREANLNPYGYDASGEWKVGKWRLKQEAGYDSQTFAHLSNFRFADEKIDFTGEFRDISKKFTSITSDGWRQGERGGSLSASYRPSEKLDMYAFLDVYQDRLFPAKDNPERLNEDFNWSASYRFDNKTSARINYSLQNELGRISQYRYQNADIGLSRSIRFLRDIELSVNYFHQEYSNYSNPPSDYKNERLFASARLNLIGHLYYYANKEVNWLNEVFNDTHSLPNVFETGLDWSDQIGKGPFHATMRFTYRDEENTASELSFLSGEDYIEGYSELNYRPKPDLELYSSVRIRNVWADNPRVAKRYEANFNAGMRYLWDTGVSWQSSGDIEGYVFKDLNSDGIMDRNEAPVEGVTVWVGKARSVVTDIFGYYLFKSVKGKLARVSLDTDTLPDGYVLTVPAVQQTQLFNHQISRLDFGIASRSEISGFVFEDRNGDGVFGTGDVGVKGAEIVLDETRKTVTDASGRYSFVSVKPDEHLLQLNLETLPVYFIPKVPLAKKILLFEGATYYYNIPVKRNPD